MSVSYFLLLSQNKIEKKYQSARDQKYNYSPTKKVVFQEQFQNCNELQESLLFIKTYIYRGMLR